MSNSNLDCQSIVGDGVDVGGGDGGDGYPTVEVVGDGGDDGGDGYPTVTVRVRSSVFVVVVAAGGGDASEAHSEQPVHAASVHIVSIHGTAIRTPASWWYSVRHQVSHAVETIGAVPWMDTVSSASRRGAADEVCTR